MNLDELQSVQSRERQTDSLQQLRESFYRDAGEFIQGLRAERERAAERADDPWNDPEISRLSDDIETAEDTVEAIYERRVGKVVKMASLAAADVPTEDEGLTDEERHLFGSLVADIEQSRDRVEAILDGQSPPPLGAGTDGGQSTHADADGGQSTHADADGGQSADSDPSPEDVDAASLMGETSDGRPDAAPASDRQPPSRSGDDTAPTGSRDATGGEATDSRETHHDPAPEAGGSGADVERVTVRITDDVGEIYGVDSRSYDLSTSDVVTLPATNADPLVESGAAERLD